MSTPRYFILPSYSNAMCPILNYYYYYLTYRHEFYETDEKVTLSIFDKGADPAQLSIAFDLRKVGIGLQ